MAKESRVRSNYFPQNTDIDTLVLNISRAEASRNSIDITCKRGSISQSQLTQIVKDNALDAFHAVGGVDGIANAINSNKKSGIHGDEQDLIWRKESYGSNTYVRPPSRSFFSFIWSALKDTTLILHIFAAALALVFGIKYHGLQEGWYEGGSMFLAVFLVVLVSGVINFKQDRQFNIQVDVTRDGIRQHISVFDVLVGDVIFLKIGDHVPADGVLINGYSMQLDEPRMTGESELVGVDSVSNPFLHSGSKVVDGHGQMLVTSVGLNTARGERMSSITRDSKVVDGHGLVSQQQQELIQIKAN